MADPPSSPPLREPVKYYRFRKQILAKKICNLCQCSRQHTQTLVTKQWLYNTCGTAMTTPTDKVTCSAFLSFFGIFLILRF